MTSGARSTCTIAPLCNPSLCMSVWVLRNVNWSTLSLRCGGRNIHKVWADALCVSRISIPSSTCMPDGSSSHVRHKDPLLDPVCDMSAIPIGCNAGLKKLDIHFTKIARPNRTMMVHHVERGRTHTHIQTHKSRQTLQADDDRIMGENVQREGDAMIFFSVTSVSECIW